MMKKLMKDRKRKYFGSLTHQLILISICLVTGTLLLCWFINTVFLEPYYVVNKQNTLLSGFETINEASENGSLDDSSFDVTFDNLCANGNITVMIISSDRTIVRSSVNDTQKMMLEFMNIIFGEKQNEVTVLMQSDNYIIQKQTDARLDSEYLVLYGTLSNGNLILMRTALESIRESVSLSNTFLAWVGVIAAIISAVVIVFVSRGITTPLLRLTDISKRMTELDFEAKYQPGSRYHNEVDELGEYMNVMSTTLEHTISELKSANNQLQIDIDKKTQIDEMRKEFLSNVSHELKTPLTSMIGYADLIRSNQLSEEKLITYANQIVVEGRRLEKMSMKLMDLIVLKKQDFLFYDMDITIFAEAVYETLLPVAGKYGVELTVNVQPAIVRLEPDLMKTVLINLFDNARKSMDGKGKISLFGVWVSDEYRIGIKDNGCGIDEENLSRLTEAFYMVDKSRSRANGGAGLGLAICNEIVKLHQAKLQIMSKKGIGTQVSVCFPKEVCRQVNSEKMEMEEEV